MNKAQTTDNPQAQAAQKKVLHVGCNMKRLDDVFKPPVWKEVRLDIDASVNPDIVASMTDLSMIKDGEYDALWSSHNIEHLFAHEIPGTLKEFYRVLNNNGNLYIFCPDLQILGEKLDKGLIEEPLYQSPSGPVSPVDILYGFRSSISRGNHFMAHKTGFVATSMAGYLKRAGFAVILIERKGYDLHCRATKIENTPEDKVQVKIVQQDVNEKIKERDNIDGEPALNNWKLDF